MELEKFGTVADVQELLSIRDRIENLLESGRDATAPRTDLLDLGDEYCVVVEVPGVSEENIELALQERKLMIAGIREPLEGNAQIVFSERPRGHFQRDIELPQAVDRERTSAQLRAGLLIINLPKS